VLCIRDLRSAYDGIVAIDAIDLEIPAGAIIAIVGANGAGKTTLLNTISGLVATERGDILFEGSQLAGLPAYRVARLGVVQVPEGRQILGPLTVEENLRLGYLAAGDRAGRIGLELEKIFDLFPILKDMRSRPAGRLSGGQQQMLAIGRALMASPRLLLLDEPSLGLAPVIVGQVFAMLQKLHNDGLTILLVEQNARRALAASSYAYVMERGRIVRQGASAALLDDPAILAHYLGQASAV
jgi:branched-chain amino acid transport system ATP-binding protein